MNTTQIKTKLCRDPNNQNTIITATYDNNETNNHITDLTPIELPSSTMIQIIQALTTTGFHISEITLTDDDETEQQINRWLERNRTEPNTLTILTSLLNDITEGTSNTIIQRINFASRTPDGQAVEGFLQSNGLLCVTEASYDNILAIITNRIKQLANQSTT